MNQQIAPLDQYIRLKYSGNASEFARAYGMLEKNMSRMIGNGKHFVDMKNGELYIKTNKQKGNNNV